MFFTKEERVETLKACRDCPMCHHIDTVAAITGKETNTPRGRGMLLWGLEKEILSWEDDGIADILYRALLDGLAQEWCDGNYDHDELVIDGRKRLIEMGKAPGEVVQVIRDIRNTGNPFGLKEGGVSSFVEKARGRVSGVPEVVLFFGPSARIKRPQIVLSFVKIMHFLKIPFEILEKETDSGFLFYQLGDFQNATDQAKKVVSVISQSKAPGLVAFSASDYRMFTTRYSRFGASLPQGMNVVHVTEFLSQLLSEKRLVLKGNLRKKVTYHDPCSLGRFTYVIEAPRQILNALAGPNFVEMEWNSRRAHCCGGGGGLSYTNPQISEKASRMRIEEAIRTGATILASSCPECEEILDRSVRDQEIEVKDLVELVADLL